MELRVRLEEALDLAGLGARGHLLDQCLHRGQVLRRQLRNRKPDSHHLERFSDLVRLDELLAGECTDDRAAPRPNGDEALRSEPAQGFAHGAATNTEGSREGELVELRAGRESAADDLVAEMLVDTLPKRPMVE